MKSKNSSSTLILIAIGISLLCFLSVSLLMGLISIVDLFNGEADPASSMIGAVAFGFMTIILGFCGWFVLQKVRGQGTADMPFKIPFAGWLWGAIPAVVFMSVFIGMLITLAKVPWLNWLFLPVLTIIVIVPPVWLFVGTAANGIELGPRWRFFSVLGLSMTVSPFMMVILEFMLLAVIIVAGSVYAALTRPEIVLEFEALNIAIQSAASEEVIVNLLAPYLSNPFLIAVGIGYIALLVPMIEELLKPLAVWLFARQVESPAQGFVLGALSGAGFALVESLNASSDGTTSWAIIVGARTGTSVLHIMTSALVGWGIASAFKEKRARRFFAPYTAAVLIHGVWNASAAGAGLSTVGQFIGKPEWLFNFGPALLCGLVVMGIGVIALLVASNRKIRAQAKSAQIEEEVKVESPI